MSTPRQIVGRVGVHDAATIWTTDDALAITHWRFDLCSLAPARAIRLLDQAKPVHRFGDMLETGDREIGKSLP